MNADDSIGIWKHMTVKVSYHVLDRGKWSLWHISQCQHFGNENRIGHSWAGLDILTKRKNSGFIVYNQSL